jgi:hypothetical protein
MGHFLAVSAFKTTDPDATVQAIVDYCANHDAKCSVHDAGADADEHTDATVYQPENGWIRVLWPMYFNVHDFPLCTELARSLGAMVSTVHVYDGDYWEHLFLNGGEVLHKFSSWPDYFAEDPDEAEARKQEWAGDVTALAAALDVPADEIAGYMLHMPIAEPADSGPAPAAASKPAKRGWLRSLFGGGSKGASRLAPTRPPAPPKAYPTDEFDLEDFWVFTDFWRKLGIVYPDPPDENIRCVLQLDPRFGKKLPGI